MRSKSMTFGTERLVRDDRCPICGLARRVFSKFWKAPPGYEVVDGRLTRRQKTSRPPDVWPEMWQAMSRKAREKSVTEWAALE
jgi:hypothetical protein